MASLAVNILTGFLSSVLKICQRGGIGLYPDSVLVGGGEESCVPLWVLEDAASHCTAQCALGSCTQLMCLEPSLFLVLQLSLWKF